ncbi:hypothetical protein E3U23_01455 [Erythrobacter litoralis]|uniref:hypothetical protein n=1 Tax=Erythrobacter litoralis TaxID=39960 RepID=UPI0024359682|nr:hypothetical protein [Erythrobacter litoralis]MDG6077865.1 hypothetical protein [Erythrobacter litoralis]
MDQNDAMKALDSVRETDRALERRARWPLWRHAAFGALEALLLLAWGVPLAAMAACIVIALGGLWWIVADDRRRYGMFVSGYSSRAALPATWLALAIVLSGLVALVLTGGPNQWTPYVLPVVGTVFVGCTLASIWWEKLYRAELRQGGVQ